MREIKFRGRDICTGEWLYGDLRQRAGCLPSIIRSFCNNGKLDYCETPIHRDSLGQFTGLHDKNGKEIYEGDIIRYDMGGECEVSYCVGGGFAGFDLSPAFHDEEHHLTDVEVIGNIHDNPELLKTE